MPNQRTLKFQIKDIQEDIEIAVGCFLDLGRAFDNTISSTVFASTNIAEESIPLTITRSSTR